jgi:hypothetical protein
MNKLDDISPLYSFYQDTLCFHHFSSGKVAGRFGPRPFTPYFLEVDSKLWFKAFWNHICRNWERQKSQLWTYTHNIMWVGNGWYLAFLFHLVQSKDWIASGTHPKGRPKELAFSLFTIGWTGHAPTLDGHVLDSKESRLCPQAEAWGLGTRDVIVLLDYLQPPTLLVRNFLGFVDTAWRSHLINFL